MTRRKVIWTSRTISYVLTGGALMFGLCLALAARLRSRVSAGEAKFQEATAELHHAYGAVREGVVILGKDQLVKYSNRQFEKALGIYVQAGMDVYNLPEHLHWGEGGRPYDFGSRWKRLNASLTDKAEFKLELRAPAGQLKLLEVFTSPVVNDAGDFVSRIWTFRDVTQNDQLQRSLFHLQKQEAIGRLASGFAHDFNNLLMGISGNLHVAQLAPDRTIEESKAELNAAIGASERAARLVKQILCFSRKSNLDCAPCDVNEILTRMDRLLSPVRSPNLTIEYELADDLPLVLGDATQLEQVFLNLCLNAINATGENGRIRVATKLVGRTCVVEVEDDGRGMAREVLDKAFEPFFTTGPNGTGLGLAVSEGIIQQHQGSIELTSELEKGTKVKVVLPATRLSTVAPEEPLPDCDLQGRSALIVDDEGVVRDALKALVEHQGVSVEIAEDGAEGCRKLRKLDRESRLPDVVLLDWSMPVMDGKAALLEMKRMHPQLPVIVCSGYAFDCEKVSQETGARPDAVLQKPYRIDQVTKVVESVLQRAHGGANSNAFGSIVDIG